MMCVRDGETGFINGTRSPAAFHQPSLLVSHMTGKVEGDTTVYILIQSIILLWRLDSRG